MVAPAPVRQWKEGARPEGSPPSIEPSPIPAPVIALNKIPKAPEIAPPKSTTETTTQPPASQPLAKNEKTPGPVTTNSPSVEMPSAANALPSETRAPLPKEPETTTQAASSPATSPATSTAMTQQSPATSPATSTAMTQQSPATEPATSNAVTQQSPATSPATKVPAPVASTPANVLPPATMDSSQAVAAEGFNLRSLVVPGLLGAGILLLVWVGYTEFRRRVSVSAYRSPAPATGPSFDSFEPETTVEKMAAPKRLAGGPPQVSLHLKASEPSVRRGAVPLSKSTRPFGSNGGGTTTTPP